MTLKEEIQIFNEYTEVMKSVFAKKRADYGPTSEETFEKFGPVSMVIRMHDKLGRLDNLLGKNHSPLVKDESAEDTLLDLANYCLITLLELHKAKLKCSSERCD